MISIALIEDHPDFRGALQKYLQTQADFICKVAVPSVEDYLATVDAQYPPEVILMDLGLPGVSGINGIKLIRGRCAQVDIMVLTVFNDANKIFDALCAGATGYLLKDTPLSKIKESVEILHAGGAPMSPPIARKVIEHFRLAPRLPKKLVAACAPQSPLTEREKEVVLGLVENLSYKMIADRLQISLDTVREYIKRIYRKLHVNSKVEVVSKSLRGEI